MDCVVTIPEIQTTFFVVDLLGESLPAIEDAQDCQVEYGAWVEIPKDVSFYPEDGIEAPAELRRSIDDPKHYKVLNPDRNGAMHKFAPTGTRFGGTWSADAWTRFAQKGLPFLLRSGRLPDTDPPGAMEAAMRYLREAR